jgi:signal-transduction protein with cAMP-binding, CBS, and nucleotidyltransferase domain
MTSPLKMVEPQMTLIDAMSLMDKMNIRRLGVKYKGQLVGIISDRNIIRLVPTIVEIIKEQQEIKNYSRLGTSTVGYCTQCETYSMNLRQIDGEFLCEDCILE